MAAMTMRKSDEPAQWLSRVLKINETEADAILERYTSATRHLLEETGGINTR